MQKIQPNFVYIFYYFIIFFCGFSFHHCCCCCYGKVFSLLMRWKPQKKRELLKNRASYKCETLPCHVGKKSWLNWCTKVYGGGTHTHWKRLINISIKPFWNNSKFFDLLTLWNVWHGCCYHRRHRLRLRPCPCLYCNHSFRSCGRLNFSTREHTCPSHLSRIPRHLDITSSLYSFGFIADAACIVYITKLMVIVDMLSFQNTCICIHILRTRVMWML